MDTPAASVPSVRDRVRGCLLGGAVGDALGAPIEFMSTEEIRRTYGPEGITDLPRSANFTDDTQMTLFTAEGLIRAYLRFMGKGICNPPGLVRAAYLRWLATQGERAPIDDSRLDGWLIQQKELHHRRAPGATCLAALRRGGHGRTDDPINDSKGCGGVMRVAPVGLLDVSDPFWLAAEAAAVTHGHPSGYLSAGALGVMVAALCARGSLDEAVDAALTRLADEDGHEEVSGALERACHAARHAPATPEAVERLGGGWVAEEALGIAVFCALKAQDFASGVLLAVNHSGDSDSTGSITGNLLGAALGERAIPDHWLGRLNARAIVETVADDLVAVQGPGSDDAHNDLAARYPPF